MHFPGEVKGAANKSEGHATGVIIIEVLALELFLFVALAAMAGKTRPPFLDCIVKAITVEATEHLALYLVATFHRHVALWFSHSHDRLL